MSAATGAPAPLGKHHSSVPVGYINESAMAKGFVRAFATACAEGVPVRLRDRVRAYRLGEQNHLIDDRVIRRERLVRDLRTTNQQLTNDLRSMEEATTERLRTHLLARAEQRVVEVESLEQELKELDAAPAAPPASTFETSTEVLLAALANIASSSRLSLEEHAAFRVVVPYLSLHRLDDGTWRAQATVRLPVTDGVAELGPITWEVTPPGVGVASMRGVRLSSSSNSDVMSAVALRRSLEQDAGVAPEAARLLCTAPFPELAHLVLHARTGCALPDWVSDEWRDLRFVAHIDAVYGVLPGRWTGPTLYGRRMPRAQAVVDCAMDAGFLTLAGYREILPGLDANDMWLFSREIQVGRRTRGAVVDKRIADDGTRALTNRRCRCGQPALIVAHAPELPGSLLCGCGRTVDAPSGSTADGLVFPSGYLELRVPREQWMRDLRRTSGQRGDELCEVSVHQANLLQTLLQDPERRWLCSQLAQATGMSHQTSQWNLDQLRRREFVRSAGRPAWFELIDVPDTLAVLARSWRRRPGADVAQHVARRAPA